MKRLEICQGDQLIGSIDFRGPRAVLRYDKTFLSSRPLGHPGVSCSLLCSDSKLDATAWCRGLLPEGQHLANLAGRIGVSTSDTYQLLRQYGRDIAGAMELSDPQTTLRQPTFVAYSDSELSDEVAQVASGERSLAVYDDSELSLAGVQNKLLLVRSSDGWARPIAGYPSTHIMKLEPANRKGLVGAEHAALQLARHVELLASNSWLESHDNIDCIVVERFDRKLVGGELIRIHQEDLLQALGINPSDQGGRVKYQGINNRPSLWHLSNVLRRFGGLEEQFKLLMYVTFNVLVGNGDAHARNYSVMIAMDGSIRLAPMYDTVPTQLFAGLKDRNALRIGDQNVLSRTSRSDILFEAQRWGLHPDLAAQTVDTLLDRVTGHLDQMNHEDLKKVVAVNIERLR